MVLIQSETWTRNMHPFAVRRSWGIGTQCDRSSIMKKPKIQSNTKRFFITQTVLFCISSKNYVVSYLTMSIEVVAQNTKYNTFDTCISSISSNYTHFDKYVMHIRRSSSRTHYCMLIHHRTVWSTHMSHHNPHQFHCHSWSCHRKWGLQYISSHSSYCT